MRSMGRGMRVGIGERKEGREKIKWRMGRK